MAPAGLAATGCGTRPMVRSSGDTYVADAGQNVIWRVSGDGQPSAWYQPSEIGLVDSLSSLGVAGDGAVLFTTISSAPVPRPSAAYRIPATPSGEPGARATLFQSADGDQA